MGWKTASLRFDRCGERIDWRSRYGLVEPPDPAQEEIDLPERAHRALDDLGKMRAMFAAVQDVANDETKAAPLKEIETTLRHMREMTKKRGARHAYCRSVL